MLKNLLFFPVEQLNYLIKKQNFKNNNNMPTSSKNSDTPEWKKGMPVTYHFYVYTYIVSVVNKLYYMIRCKLFYIKSFNGAHWRPYFL